ncbi:hypothetical protein AB0D54_37320 [Streptomyces xanthophaeus]|uniref:hypothetical protein n=1 Tax=Streptomyces xanthophaeus TaxID=67385 RepID=UPI003449286F
MAAELVELFGPRERFRSALDSSWEEIEDAVGALPEDYKDFVNGYGDATVFGYLGIPHPDANHSLYDFIGQMREAFLIWQDPSGGGLPDAAEFSRIIPWAFHGWNGDICFLDRRGVERVGR